VTLACRNEEKGRRAIKEIEHELMMVSNRGEVNFLEMDLSSLASTRRSAAEFLAKNDKLDRLILNAGVMMSPLNPRTQDGFEMQMGTNHLGHFLLTRLLIPLLKRSAINNDNDVRVVVVSSTAHFMAKKPLRLHDLNWFKEGEFTPTEAYFQSKLANIHFARELGKRLEPYGITTYSLHPGEKQALDEIIIYQWLFEGVINTELSRHAAKSDSLFAYLFFYLLVYKFYGFFLKTPLHGAQTTLYCSLEDSIKHHTGR